MAARKKNESPSFKPGSRSVDKLAQFATDLQSVARQKSVFAIPADIRFAATRPPPLVSGFNKARRLLTNRVSADFSRVAFAHLLRTFCPFNVQEAKLQDKLPAANVSGG